MNLALSLCLMFAGAIIDFLPNVMALRFYKMPTASGIHTGSLWDPNKGLLVTITFTNETPSGWQEQALPTPIPITAGVIYTASYHTTNGWYARDVNFFTTTFNNPPLHALSGSYIYNAGTVYPKNGTTSNYYADVVISRYVVLTWNTVSGTNILYNIYRSTVKGGELLTSPLATTGATRYVDTAPIAGTTDWYEVTAMVQSTVSNEVQAIIP